MCEKGLILSPMLSTLRAPDTSWNSWGLTGDAHAPLALGGGSKHLQHEPDSYFPSPLKIDHIWWLLVAWRTKFSCMLYRQDLMTASRAEQPVTDLSKWGSFITTAPDREELVVKAQAPICKIPHSLQHITPGPPCKRHHSFWPTGHRAQPLAAENCILFKNYKRPG